MFAFASLEIKAKRLTQLVYLKDGDIQTIMNKISQQEVLKLMIKLRYPSFIPQQ